MFAGWFVAGMCFPGGDDITYHLPIALWDLAQGTGANVFAIGIKWDEHTSADVVKRLKTWVAGRKQSHESV